MIFQGVKNVKNCILTLNFTFSGQLGSLITSTHAFRSLWNSSTRNTKKKNFLGFILQDITPWNHKNVRNCYFGGYFRGLGTNVEFHAFLWFCEFLKVSASIFWLKIVLTLNEVSSLILNIFQGVSSEKHFTFRLP